jgi:hypothetical protein
VQSTCARAPGWGQLRETERRRNRYACSARSHDGRERLDGVMRTTRVPDMSIVTRFGFHGSWRAKRAAGRSGMESQAKRHESDGADRDLPRAHARRRPDFCANSDIGTKANFEPAHPDGRAQLLGVHLKFIPGPRFSSASSTATTAQPCVHAACAAPSPFDTVCQRILAFGPSQRSQPCTRLVAAAALSVCSQPPGRRVASTRNCRSSCPRH